jgi:hypothetical protein
MTGNISGMPRTGRLDAPGVLHHDMIRGIERQRIFRNMQERDDLLERLSVTLPETHTSCRNVSGGTCFHRSRNKSTGKQRPLRPHLEKQLAFSPNENCCWQPVFLDLFVHEVYPVLSAQRMLCFSSLTPWPGPI